MSSVLCPGCGVANSEFNARCTGCAAVLPEQSQVVASPAALAVVKTAVVDHAIAPATLVGHYRVEGPLGAGGMGVVYRAVDVNLARPVALKFLPTGLAEEPAARSRFLREARAASALDHPHVGTIYETGEHEGRLFIAMALYEGESLAARIARAPLSIEEVEAILRQLAAALAAAHAAGIVHRDVKPGNVMLSAGGQVKLLDFGLAKLLTESAAAGAAPTMTGDVIGTVAYMAPEQLRGESLDHRCDLWALGAVAYEMVARQRPFEGASNVTILSRILTAKPVPIRQLRAEVPAYLERLIGDLLSRDLHRRPANADEVLARLGGSAPAVARGHRPRRLLLLGGIVAALVAVAGVALLLRRERTVAAPGVAGRAAMRRSVAVLGFQSLSGRPDAEWLSTALAEMVSSDLAQGEQLRVVPGQSVARARIALSLSGGSILDEDTLGRIHDEVAADVLVGGSYVALVAGGTTELRVDVVLYDLEARRKIASFSATGSEAGLFDLIGACGARLRRELGVAGLSTSDAVLARSSMPAGAEAMRSYAEGLRRLRSFDALGAREALEKTVVAEPGYPLAHAALARSLLELGYEAKARAAADKAVQLSASLRREERLLVEAGANEAAKNWGRAIDIYRALVEFFPDNLEYGLALASAQSSAWKSADALGTVVVLRALPAPARDDPRIDLAEANAATMAGDHRAALAAALRALAKGQTRGSRVIVAEARFREAYAAYSLGQTDRALEAGEAARRLQEEIGNRAGVGLALNALAVTHGSRGFVAEAIAGHLQALTVFEQIGYQSEIAPMRANLANMMIPTGRLGEARAHADEAARVSQEIGNQLVLGAAFMHAGRIAYMQGRLDDARSAFARALPLLAGEPRAYSDLLWQMAFLEMIEGRLDEARSRHQEALKIRTENGYKVSQADSNFGLARLAYEEGKAAQAEAILDEVVRVYREERTTDREANAQALLARARLARRKLDGARSAIDRAEALAAASEDVRARATVAIAAGLVRASGEAGAAIAALEAAVADTRGRGLVYLEIEARLALGEAEARAGTAAARAHLVALQKDAGRLGFALAAQHATGLLQGFRSR